MGENNSAVNKVRRRFTTSLLFAPVMLSGCNKAIKREPLQTEPAPIAKQAQPTKRSYHEVLPPITRSFPDDPRVEIAHFCGFRCKPCYQFDPLITQWLSENTSKVKYFREAPALNPSWEMPARLLYTLELFDLDDRLYHPIFDLVQKGGDSWMNHPRAAAHRVKTLEPAIDLVKFADAMNSFAVTSRLNRAYILAKSAGLSAIPSMLINGKYLIHAGSGHKGMIKNLDQLVRVESAGDNA